MLRPQHPPGRVSPGTFLRAGVAAAAVGCTLAPPASAAPVSSTPQKGKPVYWASVWAADRIPFHEAGVNVRLLAHYKTWLAAAPHNNEHGLRVLVPLCGKTRDLSFLASLPSVSSVVGVEFVDAAVASLAEEQPALALKPPATNKRTPFSVWHGGEKARILVGDFFKLTKSTATTQGGGLFDAAFDRAALVAVEPVTRGKYVDALSSALKPGGVVLLTTFERAEGTAEGRAFGPAYSVTAADIYSLFGKRGFRCEMLECVDIPIAPRFQQQGVTRLLEATWLLTKPA